MEIQSDLIILPPSNYLPLPWSVRGPLGLETGAEVSIALVHAGSNNERLPDIIVTPLQSEYLTNTYTLDVELGERAGAVADFLTWLGESIAEETGNSVNIVLSETITLEGRNKHKMHLVLEPAFDRLVSRDQIEAVVSTIIAAHPDNVLSHSVDRIYPSGDLRFMLQQSVPVYQGWIRYGDWKRRILERYPEVEKTYDLTRVVVSSNPQQRLLRFIIPKRGVIELRVPHRNRPGALKEISSVIRSEGYNILSMRLSRTPPRDRTATTSVFVAACEPMVDSDQGALSREKLRQKLRGIDTKYSIDIVDIREGKPAEKTLFLTPKRKEIVQIDPDIAADRAKIREEVAARFIEKHKIEPKKFIFISKRFIENKKESREYFLEQQRCVNSLIEAVEAAGCAVIEAANPGVAEDRYYDLIVYKAVFSRLWASDACAVLAINEEGKGNLSLSIAHEIGFFAGRNRPIKVFVTSARDKDPVFGNIVGMNRITYGDDEAGFVNSEPASLFQKALLWANGLCGTS